MKNFCIPLLILATNFVFAGEKSKLSVKDFLTWPRSNAADFGCFLEKEFNHRDNKFNCSIRNYKNHGDPFKKTKEYYEGPEFPQMKASKVHKDISEIDLSWEHGDLQSVSLTLVRKMSEEEVRKIFKLPSTHSDKRSNISSISIQQCSLKATCIILQGFDHMGAGDY